MEKVKRFLSKYLITDQAALISTSLITIYLTLSFIISLTSLFNISSLIDGGTLNSVESSQYFKIKDFLVIEVPLTLFAILFTSQLLYALIPTKNKKEVNGKKHLIFAIEQAGIILVFMVFKFLAFNATKKVNIELGIDNPFNVLSSIVLVFIFLLSLFVLTIKIIKYLKFNSTTLFQQTDNV